jgi:uncharacterized protein YjgD (DUF1641 family)
MANPRRSYPETATLGDGERAADGESDGEAALREALATHGDAIAGAVERSDELAELLTTAILVVASADEDDVGHVTASAANLIEAADGLSTDGAAALATDLGEYVDDLSASLDTVLELEREGHLDDLVAVATAVTGSLSAEEVAELSATLEENGTELVEALDLVLELQREDHLEDLIGLAKTLSSLDVDENAARGLNTFLASVGEAERESDPVGLLGMLGGIRSRDARAGLGYLLALLKAQGRRLGR